MRHLISTQSLAAIAVTLGAFAAASSAHAGSDVYFSIGVQVPGFYVQSVPVYVQPRPVYMPAPVHYGRFDEGRRFGGHHWQDRDLYGDLDRDGVRNRYDRLPDNLYRR